MWNEEKPSTFPEDVKYELEGYSVDMEEEKPPSLAPPPPIPRYRLSVANFVKPGNFTDDRRAESYDSRMSYSSVERYNEEVTMRFLFGNGKPLNAIDDEHFLTFLHHLNPTRPPPEPGNMTTKAMSQHKPDIKYQRHFGSLCVTIEAVKKNDEIFLSISAHFYNKRGERQNTVHFEKVILADYEGKVVADRIRRVVDVNKCQNFGVSYILSPNVRMLSLVNGSMPFKKHFVCFFSYLTYIAKDVCNYPDFLSALQVMREYVNSIHQHSEVYTKFKKIQADMGSNVDIPSLDIDTDWLSTLQFLSICNLLHETFTNLRENWCMPNYLDPSQENAMANLYDFLVALCSVASQLCAEDSCISQVYFSMSVINSAIENCRIPSAREKMHEIFHKYYSSITKGKNADFYSIATLLDPRYGYSTMIFNEEDWQNYESQLIHEAESRNNNTSNIIREVQQYKQLCLSLPVFDEVNTHITWWNDHQYELPILYKLWIDYSAVPAVSIDSKHFFSKGGKFAHLFATLDEEIHFKAILLAQSSQEFIGRGSTSRLIQNQFDDAENNFKRLDDVEELKSEPPQEEQMEVKQEFLDHSEDMPVLPAESQREVKEEVPDSFGS